MLNNIQIQVALTNMLSAMEGLLHFTILVGLVIHGCKKFEDALRNSLIHLIANNNIRSFILEITSVVFTFQYEASYIIICNQTISLT